MSSILNTAIFAAIAVAAASGACADVTISSAATQNMSCSDSVCAPTATNAVLNVGDLETMLAAGNVNVASTGSGVQAVDIKIADAVTWSNGSLLALDAYRSVRINEPVSATGAGGLSITTND